jgi:hypothetical protein
MLGKVQLGTGLVSFRGEKSSEKIKRIPKDGFVNEPSTVASGARSTQPGVAPGGTPKIAAPGQDVHGNPLVDVLTKSDKSLRDSGAQVPSGSGDKIDLTEKNPFLENTSPIDLEHRYRIDETSTKPIPYFLKINEVPPRQELLRLSDTFRKFDPTLLRKRLKDAAKEEVDLDAWIAALNLKDAAKEVDLGALIAAFKKIKL